MSLLSPGRGLRGAASEELARTPERIGWKVMAEVGGHEVATWSEGPGRSVEIDGKPATQGALGQVARVLWLTPAMDRLWTEAASERRRFWDRVTLSLVPDHAEAVVGYERGLRERNRLIRENVRDAGWFAAVEAQMARAGAAVSVEPAPGARGGGGCAAGGVPGGATGARGRGRALGRGRACARRCARAGGATWRRGGALSGRTGPTSRRPMPRRRCRRGSARRASRRRS